MLPENRLLVGGTFQAINATPVPFLARLNSDGSVDSSFNLPGATEAEVYSLVRLTDGKILVAGSFSVLLGANRHGLARLTADGTVDPTFDTGSLISGTVFSAAVQDDGKIWVSAWDAGVSRILRLQSGGEPDDTYVGTNEFTGFIFALLPMPGGGLLAGINPQVAGSNACLVSLHSSGQLDTSFDPGLGSNSAIFSLVREPGGQVLVGGQLFRTGAPHSQPLLRMTADLRWDESFKPDAFTGDNVQSAVIDAMALQPDGKIIAGGYFFEVGGYWRRELVRLSAEGRVDPCFDPGLGLGGATLAGAVRSLVVQNDGRIVAGGIFDGVDGLVGLHNLARF
ncbi:MAG TPA: delta-60 repeat domain-containing protein, partial [Verrucomicrobiae bacterium]|nr:delta-60 repeat domain-containing protein [Verrucomicrobiae bacterium]